MNCRDLETAPLHARAHGVGRSGRQVANRTVRTRRIEQFRAEVVARNAREGVLLSAFGPQFRDPCVTGRLDALAQPGFDVPSLQQLVHVLGGNLDGASEGSLAAKKGYGAVKGCCMVVIGHARRIN